MEEKWRETGSNKKAATIIEIVAAVATESSVQVLRVIKPYLRLDIVLVKVLVFENDFPEEDLDFVNDFDFENPRLLPFDFEVTLVREEVLPLETPVFDLATDFPLAMLRDDDMLRDEELRAEVLLDAPAEDLAAVAPLPPDRLKLNDLPIAERTAEVNPPPKLALDAVRPLVDEDEVPEATPDPEATAPPDALAAPEAAVDVPAEPAADPVAVAPVEEAPPAVAAEEPDEATLASPPPAPHPPPVVAPALAAPASADAPALPEAAAVASPAAVAADAESPFAAAAAAPSPVEAAAAEPVSVLAEPEP